MSSFSFHEFTAVQKRAVFKIAIELVKADNRIHSKEISVLDKLQAGLDISQQEVDMTHYSSLSEAVAAIREMPEEQVEAILDLFKGIMKVDSDIDFEENLLLSAIIMSCHKESRPWAAIISSTDPGVEISGKQIVYLEKSTCRQTHAVLDDKYDNLLISKAFGDIGFNFFYLPNVLEDLGLRSDDGNVPSGKFSLLQKSMGYLMPAGDKLKVDNLESALESFDTGTFFKVVTSRLNLEPDLFPFNSFLLVKIRDSVVLDDDNAVHNSADFFCLDISTDVKKRILEFVSKFDEQTNMLPYEGYYKLLYDYFSSESKINSDIIIDRDFNLCLENLDNEKVQFESAPQSKTLYLLLIHAGKAGISQDCFIKAVEYLKSVNADVLNNAEDAVFDIEAFKRSLLHMDAQWAKVIYNTVTIYQTISTKDEQRANYLTYISSILGHRSSLKTYVNKGFAAISSLAKPEQYFIQFSKEYNSYSVAICPSVFHIVDNQGLIHNFSESSLWESLI